jgi:hypothetical protein
MVFARMKAGKKREKGGYLLHRQEQRALNKIGSNTSRRTTLDREVSTSVLTSLASCAERRQELDVLSTSPE